MCPGYSATPKRAEAGMIPNYRRISPFSRSPLFVVLAASIAVTPAGARSAPVTVPLDLQAGDYYYLAFVTSGQRDATSTDIADYDAFVNAQADLSYPNVAAISWKAIASTATVSAKDHLGLESDYPIYLLDGMTRVVYPRLDSLWSGMLDNAVGIDEKGSSDFATGQIVWTGTNASGQKDIALGDTFPTSGLSGSANDLWVIWDQRPSSFRAKFYAVSDLQVVTAVPEPVSLAVWAVLGGSLVASSLRRRRFEHARNHAAATTTLLDCRT